MSAETDFRRSTQPSPRDAQDESLRKINQLLRPQTDVEPSNATIATAAGTAFTLEQNEIGFIRNLGTNPLFVKLGTGAASNSFTDVLKAGTANDDGLGGTIIIADFLGAVTVAGTSPRFIAWKR